VTQFHTAAEDHTAGPIPNAAADPRYQPGPSACQCGTPACRSGWEQVADRNARYGPAPSADREAGS